MGYGPFSQYQVASACAGSSFAFLQRFASFFTNMDACMLQDGDGACSSGEWLTPVLANVVLAEQGCQAYPSRQAPLRWSNTGRRLQWHLQCPFGAPSPVVLLSLGLWSDIPKGVSFFSLCTWSVRDVRMTRDPSSLVDLLVDAARNLRVAS